jgi:anaerobic selenocysteine-containing dehydrogenase
MATTPLARRVMIAADAVETCHPREAAILGGIVRSAIDAGRLDHDFVRRYTREIIGEFKLVNVDRVPPGSTEIDMVLSRFEAEYGPLPA